MPKIFGNCILVLYPLPPACLLCFSPPPLCSAAAGAVESRPATSCFALAPTRRAAPPPPPVASRWSLPCRATRPAEPRTARAAATSPPRWRARCRGRRPLLAHARALQKPSRSIPLVLSLAPRSHAPEHTAAIHRTPASSTPPSNPPLRSSSARADTLASSAVSPRNYQTTSPRPNLTGAPSPSFASAAVSLSAMDRPSPAVSPRTKGT